ncbi:MAG: PfkB family carbohydrate kinase, partial [Lentisphaerae bacterium]|nr:PfkB family carbohydrate kinase [Lentisphaerota bacterium]
MDRDRLSNIIRLAGDRKVAVIGDLMLDVYVWGRADRISQEAPVPVVQVRKQTQTLGGASNVMRNIVSLGGSVMPFGVIGNDEAGKKLLSLFGEQGIGSEFVISDPGRSTTQKQRVIAGTQQLVRIDYENIEPVSDSIRSRLTEGLIRTIEKGEVHAVIFEDYAKGVLNKESVDAINKASLKKGLITALDPHPSQPFEVRGLTLMTPNRQEAFALSGTYHKEPVRPVIKDAALMDVADKIMKNWNPGYLLITLGAEGMALYEKGKECLVVPTREREVFDVSGAGDTVIATFVMALLGGATP